MKDAAHAIYHDRLYENEGLPELIALVDAKHKKILDVGCGSGANMGLLAARGHAPVGATLSRSEAVACRALGLDCVVCDVRQGLPFVGRSFDALLLSHVLEHFPFPEDVLLSALPLIREGGAVYVALPNTMQFRQRYEFLRGRFRYSENGLMDRTHLRFFDFYTARQLLTAAGLKVVAHYGVGKVPLRPIRKLLPNLASRLDRIGARLLPGLFAFHILLVGVRE